MRNNDDGTQKYDMTRDSYFIPMGIRPIPKGILTEEKKMKNNILNQIVRYRNPKYKQRWIGFWIGISLGLIPYLWHMYV